MLDGRHTGTGGGNHVTLGGATPADSPLLRRPDLLRSLITYWQNHPSLSYLFSGMFVGPTSQAPRVDEARDDRLYELAIAFQQLAQKSAAGKETPQPWLVDRLLRHLLTDLTGNTHRAEFSIDKLYSPDGADRPARPARVPRLRDAAALPDERAADAAAARAGRALLARAVSRRARCPGARRCTTAGCCRTSSRPTSATSRRICTRAGYAFEPAWFEPFVEFRFPRYGTATYDGVTIELRQAIEPWHVLGEEMSGSGTARYVDSSVERMQVKVTGMTGGRHAVTCNGRMRAARRRPACRANSSPACAIARGARRRRCIRPSACTRRSRSTWSTPGRSARSAAARTTSRTRAAATTTTFPVNANEAEARRVARFWAHGHTPGPMHVYPEPPNPATPATLDLRWRPMRQGA